MDHSELLGLMNGMYERLVQDVAIRVFHMVKDNQPTINYDQLLLDMKRDFDYGEIAIDYRKLAGYVDAAEVAGELDLNEVANNIDLSDLAGSIDLADIAGEIDESDVAEQLDQSALTAALVADGDLAIQVADRLKDHLRVVFVQGD
jgi:hypothetical protein